jgi:hypothetical protein
MTTQYNAGLDSSNVLISYAPETTWSVKPAVAFKQVRILSESFTTEKTRTRPLEINPSGQAAHAITTQQTAKGAFTFGLSFSTWDDFIAAALNSSWSTPLVIEGVSGDITANSGAGTITSTTGSKFTGISAGDWIRTLGFTNAANNGVWQVVAASGASLTLAGATGVLVNETPGGTAAGVRASFVANSNTVTSFFVQKELTSSLYLQYPGSYPTSLALSMAVGKFVEGTMNFLVKNGVSAITDGSTGSQVAAPSGRIIDNIGGFSDFLVNGVAPAAVLQSVDLTISKERAASQYGIGSAAAVGMRRGTVQVEGKLSLFFSDFTYYNAFISETDMRISWVLEDNTGQAYVFTLPACTLMNPMIVAKGLDQDIIAEFTLEGNPALATDSLYPGITIQIDRLAAT